LACLYRWSKEKDMGNTNDNENITDIDSVDEAVGNEQQNSEVEPQIDMDDPIAVLESALAEAQQTAAESKDTMLRMHAEMENLRKRLIRDHEKSRRLTLERFMNDLLPVRDSLERGLEAADQSATVEALKEGKQLIMKMLTKVMGDHGLETIDPHGERFDPQVHEAMTMIPSDEHEENTVVNVLEKGYQLHDRLIRPAKVVVSRKP
jgi:molecular chaperone GrpE